MFRTFAVKWCNRVQRHKLGLRSSSSAMYSSRRIVDLRSDTLTKPTEEMRSAMARAKVGDDVYGEDPTVTGLRSSSSAMYSSRRIVDLRSDTLTKPTEEMRSAMARAKVGDDVYGEDPTVTELQQVAAEMFGKEDALFVASGTMGNLISIMCHCWERGSQALLGDQSHIYKYEQGSVAQLAGIHVISLTNQPDGTFSLDQMKANCTDGSNPHHAKTAVVAVENTMSGKIVPISFLRQLREVATEHKIKVHLDGARVMNAAVALEVPPADIAQYADSASICLSKGLGAPVGSVIVGSEDFISKARRVRMALGGGMTQCGVLAAPGLIALTEISKRLKEDHSNAWKFALGVKEHGCGMLFVDLDTVQTNMVMFDVDQNLPTENGRTVAFEFSHRMKRTMTGSDVSVKLLAMTSVRARTVFYNGITSAQVDLALTKLEAVMKEWAAEYEST